MCAKWSRIDRAHHVCMFLLQDTTPEFAWWDWVKPRETSVSSPAKITTGFQYNTSPEPYRLVSIFEGGDAAVF
jgi:hypothetical protein